MTCIYFFFYLFLFLDGFSASLSCSSIYFPYILVALTNVITGSSSLSNYVKHRSTIIYQKNSIKLRPDNYNCNYSPKSTNSSILLYKYKYTWTSCFHTHLKHAYYLNCSRVSNSCAEHILKNFKRTIRCIKHSSIITVNTWITVFIQIIFGHIFILTVCIHSTEKGTAEVKRVDYLAYTGILNYGYVHVCIKAEHCSLMPGGNNIS